MSTVAFGIAGAIAGSAIPGVGTAVGWEVGTILGGLLDPQNNTNLLKDLRVGGSSYGSSIPQLWGQNKVAGNVIWIANWLNNQTLVPSSAYMLFTFGTTVAAGSTSFTVTCNQLNGTIQPGTYWTNNVTAGGHTFRRRIRITVAATVALNEATVTCKPLESTILAGQVFSTTASITQLKHYPVRVNTGGGSGGLGGNNAIRYTASFMVCFGESSIYLSDGTFINRNQVIKRLWLNGILYYDVDYPNIANGQVTIRIRYGGETQVPDTLVCQAEAAGDTWNCDANRGLITVVFDGLILEPFGNTLPTVTAEIWSDAVTTGDVIGDITAQVELKGLSANVSDCTQSVTGFNVAGRMAAQDGLSNILPYYFIDVAEYNMAVNFVPRGGGSIYDINPNDLGAFSENKTDDQTITLQRTRGIRSDVPGRVDLTYIDVDNGYQQLVQSAIKYTGDFFNPTQVTVQISMTATEAVQMAHILLYVAYMEMELFEFSLPWKYEILCPTDQIYLQDPDVGVTYQLRIIEMDISDTAEIKFKAVPERASLYEPTVAPTLPSGITALAVTGNANPVDFGVWSGFALRPQDKEIPGFYAWADWDAASSGGTVYYSADSGTTWMQGPTLTQPTAIGVTTDDLPAATGHDYWDAVNSLGILLNDDGGVFSPGTVTAQQVLNGNNIALINGAEVVGFETVANPDYLTYTLTNLRRGLLGSGGADNPSGSTFVILTSSVTYVPVNSSFIGVDVLVVVLAPGQMIADVPTQTVEVITPTLTENTKAITTAQTNIAANTADIATINSTLPTLGTLNRTTVNDVDYTTVSTDRIVAITTLTAIRTITLPTPGSGGAVPSDTVFYIKDESGDATTYPIDIAVSGANIDGSGSTSLSANFGSVGIYHNGTNYFTV